MGRFIDMTGRRFGRLTVVQRNGISRNKEALWLCKCDCGNEVTVNGCNLRHGGTQSCGCYNKDRSSEANSQKVKHNGYGTRLYNVWIAMKVRCLTPTHKNYKDYGGRGITICQEWQNDFGCFRDWAMANGYDPTAPRSQCTIDRIDVDGNYEPSNCRWVSMKVQGSNKRVQKNKKGE